MICKSCAKDKPQIEFYRDIRIKRGFRHTCKKCTKNKGLKEQPEIDDSKESEFKSKFKPLPVFNFNEKISKGQHYSIALAAPRRSGKTYLLKHLWPLFKKQFDIRVFFSHSIQAPIYKFLKTDEFCASYDDYVPDVLKDLETFQKKTDNSLSFLVCMDDCIGEKDIKGSNDLIQLFTRGRNKGHSVIFSMQDSVFLNKSARSNVDYLFLFRPRGEMYDTIPDRFLNQVIEIPGEHSTKKSDAKKYTKEFLTYHTENYNILVVDYINGQLYSYKVPIEEIEDPKQDLNSQVNGEEN